MQLSDTVTMSQEQCGQSRSELSVFARLRFALHLTIQSLPQLSAFTAAYRTHAGNLPQLNAQFWTDADTLAQFRFVSLLFDHIDMQQLGRIAPIIYRNQQDETDDFRIYYIRVSRNNVGKIHLDAKFVTLYC